MAESRSKPDQYQLRFPPGLRDRIRIRAEKHGRSMNEEIIRALEEAFPEPWGLDRVVDQILGLTHVVRGAANNETVGALADALFNVVEGIAAGKVKGLTEDQKNAVRDRFDEWIAHRLKEEHDRITADMGREELAEFNKTGHLSRY